MQNVILTNDFHNSSVTLRCFPVEHYPGEITIRPTAGQIRKAKKTLCGISGCTCGGIRGSQTHNGKRLTVDYSSLYAKSEVR